MATVYRELMPEDALFATSAFPQYLRINGTNSPESGLAYDATNSETAHWKLLVPDYASGNLTVTVHWYADTATTGGVAFEAAVAAITPNTDTQDVETKAYATAATATDTHLGTTGQRAHSFDITVTALDSLAAGDWLKLKLSRLPANAADTMAGDAIVTMVSLSYSNT